MTVNRTPVEVSCTVCNGTTEITCYSCKGTGTFYDDMSDDNDDCYTCHGHKRIKCHTCDGKGKFQEIQGRHFKAVCHGSIWLLMRIKAKHNGSELYGDGLPGTAYEAFLVVRGMDMVIESRKYENEG